MIDAIVTYQRDKYYTRKASAKRIVEEGLQLTHYALHEDGRAGYIARTRDIQMTEQNNPIYKARVSVTTRSSCTGYIEVAVNVQTKKSECPCKYFDETGIQCVHVKALLLKIGECGLDWYDEIYHASTYHEAYNAVIPSLCVAGKLQANEQFLPPDHRRPAGRPAKKRKERSHLRMTDTVRVCKACGGDGHFASTCTCSSFGMHEYQTPDTGVPGMVRISLESWFSFVHKATIRLNHAFSPNAS